MKSSNLAIVFVDIAGFTERTGSQSRQESAAWLRRYEELLVPLVRALGGRRVKAIGDAYLCTFVSPTNALLFGMAAQDRLYAYNRRAPEDERIEIRVAVNVGEVREHRGDVFGEPVNIAARLEGLTPVGEVWFTEAVYLAMTKSEVPSEEVGMRALKGIRDEVRLYRIPVGGDYRLQGRAGQDDEPDQARPDAYPYGGIGLKRAEERGWAISLGDFEQRVRRAGSQAVSGLGGLAGHIRTWPGHIRPWLGRLRAVPIHVWAASGVVVAAAVLVALLVSAGPFAEVEQALDEGRPERALELLRHHARAGTPAGQVMQARALLAGKQPACERAAGLLHEATERQPDLANDPDVVRAWVACLDRSRPAHVMDYITDVLGHNAVPALLAASRSRRYHLRWNSIRVLKRLGELDAVDMGHAYIQDLRFGGSCSTRKRAARKLAELRDDRAVEHLRRAKDRGFLDNLCMGDALDEAIRAIEQ